MKIISYIDDIPIDDYSEEELLELWTKVIGKAAQSIGMELVFE